MLALGVYILRRRLAETASFEAMKPDRPKSTARNLWRDHPREFVLVAAITAGGSLAFYAYTTYLQKFLVNTSGFDRQTATVVMTAALVVFMLAQPLFGHVADRFGRKPMLLFFGVGGMIVSVPVFSALAVVTRPDRGLRDRADPATLLAAYTSISALVKAELFPAHIRTLGVALPYAVGNTLFGGTAEYVAFWFKGAGVSRAPSTGMSRSSSASRPIGLPDAARDQADEPDLRGLTGFARFEGITMARTDVPVQLLVQSNETDAIKVKTREGEKVGSVHNYLINKRSGRAAYVVLTIGGFLGMGKAYYPLPFGLLAFDPTTDSYIVRIDRRVLEGGPSWASNPPLFDQAYANRVASYYGTPLEDLSLG